MNNTEEINKYLNNDMSSADKLKFENRLVVDAALQKEVNAQRLLIDAIVHAGIKNEFAKVMYKKPRSGSVVMWISLAAAVIIAILLFNFSSVLFPGKDKIDIVKNKLHAFINPPLAAIDVPFSEFIFDAEKGDTFSYRSGSVICIPKGSLVDASGNPVTGEVKVRYREFSSPIDFFVSGIPMSYDSGNVKYNFESSGMCEINAYQNGKALFINKEVKPEIHLSVNDKNPKHNLYYLDTVKRQWDFMGKDRITEIKMTAELKGDSMVPVNENAVLPLKPVKPIKASDDKQAFSVEIAPGSFEELQVYNGVKFQVEDETNYKRSDAEEEWSKMNLDRTATAGIYMITFSNERRTVSYKVRPVLEGENYDAALNLFKQKNLDYENALQSRLQKDKLINDSIRALNEKLIARSKEEQEYNEKVNKLIDERNKRVREFRQQQMDIQQKIALVNQQALEDQFLAQLERFRKNPDMRKDAEIMRSFTINGFGVWNCDHPQYPGKEIPIAATFTDSSNSQMNFTLVSVVYEGFNGITQFSNGSIRVMPGSRNMLWAIRDEKFYYYPYKDFEAAAINSNTRQFTFRMRSAGKQVSSYEEIKKLVEQL